MAGTFHILERRGFDTANGVNLIEVAGNAPRCVFFAPPASFVGLRSCYPKRITLMTISLPSGIPPSPMPEIIVKLGDRIIHRYFFDKEMVSVGRARDNDIVIENLSVSRNHARLKKQDGKFILTDMNSANGTLVNGVRVSKTEVAHNDEITVGKHTLIFLAEDAPGAVPAQTAAADDPSSVAYQGEPSSPALPASARLGVLNVIKGKQLGTDFRITRTESRLGRAGENDIRIHDWFVSKKHATISFQNGVYLLRDLDSWRGTTVNGNSIREIELKDGDEIVVGTTTLTFRLVDPASLPAQVEPALPEEDWGEGDPEWESNHTSREVPLPTKDSSSSQRALPTSPPSVRSAPKGPAHNQEIQYAADADLDQLESEFDQHVGTQAEEEENRRAAWEMAEMERAFETGADSAGFSLGESDEVLREAEESFCSSNISPDDKFSLPSDYDAEEEEALYGALMTDTEPYGEPVLAVVAPPSAPAIPRLAAAPAPSSNEQSSRSSVSVPILQGEGAASREIAMWEKALTNKSALIRKNAAKELKKLTGKDYDWTIDPSGH